MTSEIKKPKKEKISTKAEPNMKSHGGYRPGCGRPVGSKDAVTISGLLEQVFNQTQGKDYEELLIEDFMKARNNSDSATVIKYHNLILSKVMNSLAKIEVTDSADAVAAKQQAFADALAKLTGVKNA
jgi:hypothetical protein